MLSVASVNHPRPRVIVVGGGLAGLAAAGALNDRGMPVTLIERRVRLGGRATSFPDPQGGELLDNCQHVLLGCCTSLLHFYQRMEVAEKIRFFDTIHFADSTGRRADIYANNLPSPFHLAAAMARFKLLGMAEKIELARAMMAMKLLGRDGRNALADVSFESFLKDHGQSAGTIERFWNVILVSALNADAAHASAKYGVQVFQESFLGHRTGYRLAVSDVPLAELYPAAAVGGEVITSTRVQSLVCENGRVGGVRLEDGRVMHAEWVILAVAPDSTRKLLGGVAGTEAARLVSQLARLEFGPILGVHLWYDRPVMQLPHLALIGTKLHWLFRKDALGTRLHGVVSAADELVAMDQDELARLLEKEIRGILPGAQAACLRRWLIVKEKRATFVPHPGIDAIRPGQKTAIPGLILAGDYTRTDWPATMEGAVRSGYLAAEAVPDCAE